MKINFASDNYAGVAPEMIRAIESANQGAVPAYGSDPYTLSMQEKFRGVFGENARAHPVFNGTGANIVALGSVIRPYESIICAEKSHIQVDECGAPEHILRVKLELIATPDQKITPAQIREKLVRRGDIHYAQARVVSITNSTEYGTVYTASEIRAIADVCHENGLYLHCDGSRLSNAAASLGTSFRAITTDAGVDFLSFGATKNGALAVEAVVFLNPALGLDFEFHRKQNLQLSSKMRFSSAQLECFLDEGYWRKHASHANQMAERLEQGLKQVPGFQLTQKRQANAIFAILPKPLIDRLQSQFVFYVWNELTNEVRLMTSFQTTESDVEAFLKALKA